jgi:hypothetical protein
MSPFEIKFDFPLAHSDLIISLKATVELHHSQPYYVVDHFRAASSQNGAHEPSILPPQEIKQVQRNSAKVWVHKDSEKESVLSIAMGKGIDEALTKRQQ